MKEREGEGERQIRKRKNQIESKKKLKNRENKEKGERVREEKERVKQTGVKNKKSIKGKEREKLYSGRGIKREILRVNERHRKRKKEQQNATKNVKRNCVFKLFLKFLFPGLIDINLSGLENFILTKQHNNTCYMKYTI